MVLLGGRSTTNQSNAAAKIPTTQAIVVVWRQPTPMANNNDRVDSALPAYVPIL
jgi:hypothetical protein